MTNVKLVDCTLRDGGYYNAWDFDKDLIDAYLKAMDAISADFVEIGFRSLEADSFKGGCAYSTDDFLRQLELPLGMKLGVMVNGSELAKHHQDVIGALSQLFVPAQDSPVTLVRIACHLKEFEVALPGCQWLKDQGYIVGINLMQIADRSEDEIEHIGLLASEYPLDALYFADSMGSMTPDDTARIIGILRRHWRGALGIHTHDNMGNALANSMRAVQEGATWIDGTVTGMGRGPGNVKTEYLAIELEPFRNVAVNIIPLMTAVRKYFRPLQIKYGWGTNTFYFLAGKYGIHPSYVQEMLCDSRYSEEDIIAVLEHLREVGGKSFSSGTLEQGRQFYSHDPAGAWSPSRLLAGKDVLLLGAGAGVERHRPALEGYIRHHRPIVIALNTQTHIAPGLINLRAACHPVRLLADCDEHVTLPQPLITPFSMLPDVVKQALGNKDILDFGISVRPDTFAFNEHHGTVPTLLVVAYALAIATSGNAARILLAGFDGYSADDPRQSEMDHLLETYQTSPQALRIISLTPTRFNVAATSVYA